MKAGKKSNAEAQRGRDVERTDRWPLVRLGDVCEVRAGADYKAVLAENGPYPIYGTGGEMGRASQWRCPANSVIVGRKGTLDNPMLITEPFWNIDTCFGVIPSESIVPEYLYRFCQNFDFYSLVPASGRPSTTSEAIRAITLPLPPLATQRAIVERLDSALARARALEERFAAIAKNAELSFKVALNEEIGKVDGKKARLGNVFRFIDYRGMTPTKTETGIPLITAKNIRFGYMDYHEQFFISKSDYATRQTRGIAHKGDILFTTEAPLGYVAIADKEVFSTGQRIITFQWPNDTETHDNRYFLYYFMSDRFQSHIRANASGATAQGIKASRLVNLLVIVPPLSVQRAIVSRLDAARKRADGIAALARQAAEAAANLKKALLKEAFE